MKLTRKTWLILALGVLIIAFASLYVVYSRQASRHKDLKSSLSEANAGWLQLITERKALENQLAQRLSELADAQSALNKLKAKFPPSSSSIEYDELLFEIADDCDLEVLSLTASEPSQETVGEVTYVVTSFQVGLEGELASMLDFIDVLTKSDDFASATIEVVNISLPESATGGGETDMPSATIQLAIYSYQGE